MGTYEEGARVLRQSRHAVALTGAGISVESGIPDFRSAGGLWSRYDPMEYGHIDSFREHPEKVWQMLREMDRVLASAAPNGAHFALAELERRGALKAVITQNVDSLHQRAGSKKVIEFHGHNRTLRCDRCLSRFEREQVSLEASPPRCASCGHALRPEFVFFGEEIPMQAYNEAMREAQRCDVMLIVGTSATVAPASLLPRSAKSHGAFLIEINPTSSELSHRLTDLHIAEPAGRALPALLEAMDGSRQNISRGRSE